MILHSVRICENKCIYIVYGISGLLQWLVVWQNTITKKSCITIEGNCDIMHGVISLPDAMSYDKDWKHGNLCYELVNRKVSWSGAVKLCAQMNSYLVEVDHQPEHDVIVSNFWENFVCIIWLGASYFEAQGN